MKQKERRDDWKEQRVAPAANLSLLGDRTRGILTSWRLPASSS